MSMYTKMSGGGGGGGGFCPTLERIPSLSENE